MTERSEALNNYIEELEFSNSKLAAIEIMRILDRSKEIPTSTIAEKLELENQTVLKHLKELEARGGVRKKKIGHSYVWTKKEKAKNSVASGAKKRK